MVDRILKQIPWSLGGKNEWFLNFFGQARLQPRCSGWTLLLRPGAVMSTWTGQKQNSAILGAMDVLFTNRTHTCCISLTSVGIFRWKEFHICRVFLYFESHSLAAGSLNRKTHVHSKHSVWFDNADSFQLNVGASRVLQEACPAPGFQQRYHFHTFSKQLTQVFLQMQHSWCRNVFCGWVAGLWARTSWEENNTMKKKFWFSLCCYIFVSFVDFFVDLFLSFK